MEPRPAGGDLQSAVVELGSGQHSVFSLAQLAGLGLTRAAVYKRAQRHHLHRVYLTVYSLVPPELLTRHGRWMAAVLACGPGAVLSHRSAAALHDLRATSRSRIDVTVPGRTSRSHPTIDVHRSTTLTAADTTTVDDIPCTTIARTLLDLAAVLPARQLERALERAETLQRLDARALTQQLARHPFNAGVARLRDLLARSLGSPTDSELEERFLSLCRTARLPEPQRQAYVDPGDGDPLIRADFLWSEQKLIVETDGHAFHGTRQSFESDRRRDQRLIRAGWRVVRITWRQLIEAPDEIVRLLTELLRPA